MLRSLRLGFATNSSSAHSIIFDTAGAAGAALPHAPLLPAGLGRADYVAAAARDKAVCLLMEPAIAQSAHARLAIEDVLMSHGIDMAEVRALADHPDFSEMESLPSSGLSMARAAGIPLPLWVQFLMSDAVALVGYDDNDDAPFARLEAEGRLVDVAHRWPMRLRHDPGVPGGAITAYDTRDGTKFRWAPGPYEKATAPELVDVKVTDFCRYGCAFCYQGSTEAGAHACPDHLDAVFRELAAQGVFEIAIGGGEPAHHPAFADILHSAVGHDLTVNFTAFGLDWARDPGVLSALSRRNCGIGLSVHSKRDVTKILRARDQLKENGLLGIHLMAQAVVGATPMTTLEPLLEACIAHDIPLLLLGYKTTGRGEAYARKRVPELRMQALLERARDAARAVPTWRTGFTLSVDTAFLEAYGPLLDRLDVPAVLRTSPEGKFSMYVDAVTRRCGPSSYCPEDAMRRYEAPDELRAHFAAF